MFRLVWGGRFGNTKLFVFLFGLLSVFLLSPLVRAGTLTQGYRAKTALPVGAIVSLTKNGAQEVEKATTNNDSLIVGVVVNNSDSLIEVQPEGSQISVATSGEVKILASTVNGDIKQGDKLIASPLAGVAAVDFPPAPGVKYVAVADESLDSSTADVKKLSVKRENGQTKEVFAKSISARMLLGNRTSGANNDKNVLVSIGSQISGKRVSIIQVLAAVAVFGTTIALSGMILQGSIRGTFVSLGRNPLSRDSILTGLMRVVVFAALVLSVGVIGAYAILVL